MRVWKKLILLLSYSLLISNTGAAVGTDDAKLSAHADFDLADYNLDIDEAWIRTGKFTWGRIHPYQLSNHFESKRPWGLLAQKQTQNRGLGFSSEPTLQGWVGAHYWSDPSRASNFQFGFSASPLFIPSRGNGAPYPQFVEMNGRLIPLEISVDTNDIYRELLAPQLMAQAYYRAEGKQLQWEAWTTVSRSPSPNPDLETTARLDLRGETPVIRAKVKPHFRQMWLGSFSQRLRHASYEKTALFSTVSYQQDGAAGVENGIESRYFAASHANELLPVKAAVDYEWEMAPYGDQLIQWEAKLPTSYVTLHGGTKHHIFNGDSWRRFAISSNLNESFSMRVGADLFAGKQGSYFGQWRGQDRLYLGLTWNFSRGNRK